MVGFGAIAGLICGVMSTAGAGPFSPKTMQGELSEYQVERALVLPKGWLEVGLSVDHKRSDTYRGSDGGRRDQPAGFLWSHSQMWLDVRQGFSPRVTLYARVPWVRSELQPIIGTSTTTMAMGDAHTGLVVQPWTSSAHSLAFSADLKAPSGVEWPSGTGAPGNTKSFLTGTGITNFGLYSHGKVVVGQVLSVRGDVGYVRKFPGVVGYVVQVDGFGNGILNPGDEVQINANMTAQIGPNFWLRMTADFRHLGETWVGVTGPAGGRIMSPIRHTAGEWLDGGLVLGIEPSVNWTITLRAQNDLVGSDTRPFAHLGLEELSPQSGLTLGAGVVARW
jgi:hypothetical protein